MSVDLPPGLYRLKGGNIASGTMRVLGPKKYILEKDSEARDGVTPSCPEGISAERSRLQENRILVKDGKGWRLTKDHEVGSSSLAAGILMGSSQRGPAVWELVSDEGPSNPTPTSAAVSVARVQGGQSGAGSDSDESHPAPTPEADQTMDRFIDSTVTTFQRERQRYSDLVELVRTKMSELTQNMVVAIQYRVKDPESLRKKLAKYASVSDGSVSMSSDLRRYLTEVVEPQLQGKAGSLDSSQVGETWKSQQEAVLDLIPDLAGVRVLFYREDDMQYLIDRIQGRGQPPVFKDAASAAADDPESLYSETAKRKSLGDWQKETNDRYQAHHERLVYLARTDDTNAALDFARCEVQITTVAKHLMNEVGHEVDYKRPGALSSRDVGRIDEGLETLQEMMGTLQERVDKLFARAGIPPAREADNAAKQTGIRVDEFWSTRKNATRAERLRSDDVRKWLLILADYAALGTDQESKAAQEHLSSKSSVARQWRAARTSESQVAEAYNGLYGPGGRDDPRRLRQLDVELDSDLWLLKILYTLPTGFLRSFADDKGTRSRRIGRPPLIVDIADAFLEAKG